MTYTPIPGPGTYVPVPPPPVVAAAWTRPTDWLALPTVGAAEQKFVGVLAVTNDDSNFIALNAAGNYTVNWGDGVSEDIATGVQANHLYTYSAIPAATLTSLGYKQVIVTVTPQAGQTLTTLNLHLKHSQTGLNAYNAPWLDITVGSPALTSLTIGGAVVGTRSLQRATVVSHAITNTSSLFASCTVLQSVPLFDTSLVTNMTSMFSGCTALVSVPLFNTAAVTNMTSMFSGCTVIRTVPLFNTALVTNISSMFNNCFSLQSIPAFNTAAVGTWSSMVSGCAALSALPALSVAGAVNLTSFPSTVLSLADVALVGIKNTLSLASAKLSTATLERIFASLTSVSGQTITISSNWGAPTQISTASSTTTSGSTTVTMASTTGLVAGMEVSGTGVSTAVAVTMQDAGDTVTRTAHGIPNGTLVSFATIVTTTGVLVRIPYYVVNAAADTFQVSATLGGAALPLTTDGSGTLLYGTTIVSIVTDTSIVLSIPASANGTVTLSSAVLRRSLARIRGWTVTG